MGQRLHPRCTFWHLPCSGCAHVKMGPWVWCCEVWTYFQCVGSWTRQFFTAFDLSPSHVHGRPKDMDTLLVLHSSFTMVKAFPSDVNEVEAIWPLSHISPRSSVNLDNYWAGPATEAEVCMRAPHHDWLVPYTIWEKAIYEKVPDSGTKGRNKVRARTRQMIHVMFATRAAIPTREIKKTKNTKLGRMGKKIWISHGVSFLQPMWMHRLSEDTIPVNVYKHFDFQWTHNCWTGTWSWNVHKTEIRILNSLEMEAKNRRVDIYAIILYDNFFLKSSRAWPSNVCTLHSSTSARLFQLSYNFIRAWKPREVMCSFREFWIRLKSRIGDSTFHESPS